MLTVRDVDMQRLANAVVFRALLDLRCCGKDAHRIRAQAREWLLRSPDLRLWCEIAGDIDADAIREAVRTDSARLRRLRTPYKRSRRSRHATIGGSRPASRSYRTPLNPACEMQSVFSAEVRCPHTIRREV
jgi:hypothetical protein